MHCKANRNSPELYLRKTAIAREVTLDSQDAVKFLSIWLKEIKMSTTTSKKNKKFSAVMALFQRTVLHKEYRYLDWYKAML
jgi:hypothetical protein